MGSDWHTGIGFHFVNEQTPVDSGTNNTEGPWTRDTEELSEIQQLQSSLNQAIVTKAREFYLFQRMREKYTDVILAKNSHDERLTALTNRLHTKIYNKVDKLVKSGMPPEAALRKMLDKVSRGDFFMLSDSAILDLKIQFTLFKWFLKLLFAGLIVFVVIVYIIVNM